MKKNLVVEGMDGSGKTTLIGQILQWYPQLGEVRRACTPEGPIENTTRWLKQDIFHTVECGIYDQHPLVSGLVYPAVIPDLVETLIESKTWNSVVTRELVRRSVFIFCDPGLSVVEHNLDVDQGVQAHGVRENAPALYAKYHDVMGMLEDGYGAVIWSYNYRQPSNELPGLRSFIEKVIM